MMIIVICILFALVFAAWVVGGFVGFDPNRPHLRIREELLRIIDAEEREAA